MINTPQDSTSTLGGTGADDYASRFAGALQAMAAGGPPGMPQTQGNQNGGSDAIGTLDPDYDGQTPVPDQDGIGQQMQANSSTGAIAKSNLPMPRAGMPTQKMPPAGKGSAPSNPAAGESGSLGTLEGAADPGAQPQQAPAQGDPSQGGAPPTLPGSSQDPSQSLPQGGSMPGNAPPTPDAQLDHAMKRAATLHVTEWDKTKDKTGVADHLDKTIQDQSGGAKDLDTVFNQAYNHGLGVETQRSAAIESQANRVSKPTWTDKAAMVLDMISRAAIIHQINPGMPSSTAFSLAASGAVKTYHDRLAGLHDASVQQSRDMEARVTAKANATVNRVKEQSLYEQQMAAAQKDRADSQEAQSKANTGAALLPGAAGKQDSETQLNLANARKADADAGKLKADAGNAKKPSGDLVTVTTKDDNGNDVQQTGYINKDTNVFTPAKDPKGKPIGPAQKTGTEPKPQDDSKQTEAAARELDRIETTIASTYKNSMNLSDRRKTPDQIHQEALTRLQNTSPDLYRSLTKDSTQPRGSQPQPRQSNAPVTASKPAWAS